MWRDYKSSTGPLDFGLDDSTGISCGVMNYELGIVSAEFHVLVRFRWFALQLKALGMCGAHGAVTRCIENGR
jgi:hypothetical protein